jgi:vancomycin resistance protein YoaR
MTIKRTAYLFTPLLAAVVFIVTPQFAEAGVDWAPVPTFNPVNTFTEIPTATVPANLVSSWRGVYTVPSYNLVKRPEINLEDMVLGKANRVPNTKRTYKFDPAQVYAWTKQLGDSINASAVNPEIEIVDGRVKEFTPPQTGRALDRYNSTIKIIESLQEGKTTTELVVYSTNPGKQIEELNKLGIKELIGRGESKFNGSPRNRRHNINVGVNKMKGIIIKPGEEFSFNKYLGPVEASTGFLPELVIKKTGTVPEFGGGLCQVSSTTFRAAMHAGLPITARRNHSYAVQYYAPQGSDATIYPGVQDLKFTNDTGNSILIWPYFVNADYLIFDFYGTYDNRKVQLDKPVAYDKKSDGSMRAYWTRTVTTKDGQVKNDKFSSVYQPPALFHREESYVNTTGQQTTPTQPVTPAQEETPKTTTPPPLNTPLEPTPST